MANNHFDVVVIGAGISGLIATRRLLSCGISSVALLEARDRIGGRIEILKNGDDVMDMGAHFVHGTIGNAVYSFAEPLGLLMPPDDFPEHNCYISARDGQKIDEELASEFEDRFDELFEECRNNYHNCETLADIFAIMKRHMFTDPDFKAIPLATKEDLFTEFVKVECVDLATSNPHEVTASGAALWQDCQDPYYCMLKDGYSSIMPLIANKSVQQVTRLLSIVTKIVWSDAGCVIHCQLPNHPETIKDFFAKRVICTVPLGCLKAGVIEFVPPLPTAKMSAISSLGVGLLDKYNVQFETKWWPANVGNLFIVWPSEDENGECDLAIKKCLDPSLYKNEKEMTWYRHTYAFDVEPIVRSGNYLVSYASGDWAALIESLPDDEVMRGFGAIVSQFLTAHFPDAQMPIKIFRSKWALDPFARGSYTVMAMGSTPGMLDDFAEPLPSRENPRLMFAGEAAHPHFFSAVHGAWEAGEREADRIVEAFKQCK